MSICVMNFPQLQLPPTTYHCHWQHKFQSKSIIWSNHQAKVLSNSVVSAVSVSLKFPKLHKRRCRYLLENQIINSKDVNPNGWYKYHLIQFAIIHPCDENWNEASRPSRLKTLFWNIELQLQSIENFCHKKSHFSL